MHHVGALEFRKLALAVQTGKKALSGRLKSPNIVAVMCKSTNGTVSLVNGVEGTVLSVKALAGVAYIFII